MFRDAALVAGKDLRIELRSRVASNQIAPFAVLVLVLFAFALDPDRGVLERATPGLYWVTILFASILAVQRSFTVEATDGGRDALRLSGLDAAGIFIGKAAAIAFQLLALEAILAVGVLVLYGAEFSGPFQLVAACILGTVGLSAAGTVYGIVAAGLRVRETLLPLLVLPVLAPVLLAGTEVWEAALTGAPEEAWRWLSLLGVFGLVYTAVGIAAFGALLEET